MAMVWITVIIELLKSIEANLKEQKHEKPFTASEAANYMSIKMSHLYKLVYAKKLPSYKPNKGKLYFFKSELDHWIKTGQLVQNN